MIMVTVGVALFTLNEEKNIRHCLENLLEAVKPYDNATVYVLDGNSTDKTCEISESYGVKCIIEPKRTFGAARQKAIEAIEEDVIAFFDADAIPEENWFKNLTEPFENENVMATSGCVTCDSFASRLILRIAFKWIAPVLFKFQIPLVSGQVMAIRRKESLKIGFNTDFRSGEDTYIFLKLRDYGKIVHTNACVKVSERRIEGWGFFNFIIFHIRNYISLLRYEKPLEDEYEPIRD